MFARFNGKILVLALVALALTGCFRQAGPGIEPTVNTGATQVPLASPISESTGTVPFVTPFVPADGPDMTTMPTLAGPSPTPPAAAPASVTPVSATPGLGPEAQPTADQGILPTSAIEIPPTAPFAAGPTFTPIPGVPTVDPNAGVRATPTELGESSRDCIHVVEIGESAYHIATLYDITLAELIEANNLENADLLSEGQELVIPNCGEDVSSGDAPSAGQGDTASTPVPRPPGEGTVHVVQQGENLFRISLQYGVTVDDIVQANSLGSPDAIIHPGQELIIPGGG